MGQGFDNTNQQQQQQTGANGLNANDVYPAPPQNNQPWRPTYGQVAPIYGNGNDGSIGAPNQTQNGGGQVYEGGLPVTPRPVQGTPYQPAPYNQTPTDGSSGNNGSAYNPGGGGAAYNPGGGGAAYNPGDQQQPGRAPALGDNGQSGPVWNQPNPRQQSSSLNDTSYDSAPVVQPIGIFAGSVMGGLGGIAGGSFIPKWGNKAADAILKDAPAGAESVKPGFFAEGGSAQKIFGKTFTEKVGKGVDDLTAKAGGLDASSRIQSAATGWQNTFDPRYQNRVDMQKMLDETNSQAAALNAKGVLSEADQATLATLNQKQNILSAGEGAAANKLNPGLFTADGKAAINSLKDATPFSEAEMKLLNSQRDNLGKAFPEASAATKDVAFLERPMVGNFAKGAAVVGGSLLADHIAGNFIGKNGAGHLSEVALPMAWLAGGSWKEKAIYSAAAIVGSKTIDALLPAQDHTTINRIMAPNSFDSLSMGAAFVLPAADPRTRMAMVGGAWAFGRLRNMNDTESFLTTGALAGATGLAMKVGRINPELGVGLLAAEGGAFLLSRVFKGNTGK